MLRVVQGADAGNPFPVLSERTLELLPAAAYVCAVDGSILHYNRRAVELWGRAPRAGLGEEYFCCWHRRFWPDGRLMAASETPVADVLRTGNPVKDREVWVERPSGVRLWISVCCDPIHNDAGEVTGAITLLQDITARRQAELELSQQYDQLDDFFENGAIGLHVVGADGRIVRANRAELTLLGYTIEEYVGRHIAEFHVDHEAINDILHRLARGETLNRYDARLRAKDGSIKHVQITSSGRFRAGQFSHTRCFTVDVTEQHLAEEAARDGRQRLSVTYQAVPAGLAEVDGQGRFIRVNDALTLITGFPQDELLNRSFLEITHPEDRAADAEWYRRLVDGDIERYSLEKRFIRRDGASIFVEVVGSAVRDDDGRFRYGVRVVQDITERRHAQLMLEESERRTREILDALPAAVYTTDAAGHITYFNQAAIDFAGRLPELGDKWCVTWRLFSPDGTPLPHDQCPMAITLKEGRPVRGVEAVAERPDGTRVPFIPYPTPLRDSSGKLTGAINVLVDISENKRSSELAQRLAAIVNTSQDAIISKDLSGIVQTWNDGARRLFGYEADEVIGQPITILIPPERQEEEARILDRIGRGERIEPFETVRRRKDGSLVDISLSVSPLHNIAGRVIGASKIARDVTERRKAHERQRLLINELNHRVKNTLAVVQSLARQSVRSETENPGYKQFEARLLTLSVAHNILTEEQWESADLAAIAARVVAPHCADPARVHISGPSLRVPPATALALAMAFHELCTNALKYGALSNETGQVRLEWAVAEDEAPRRLRIRWQEAGGPPVAPPARKGFGTRLLLRGLARELEADVRHDFQDAGVVCTIDSPLPV
jgi:PAS domain S-box-containing protein